MSKRIIYPHELPEPDVSSGSEACRDMRQVENYLSHLIRWVQHETSGSETVLLPSIAELAQRMRVPRQWVVDGFLQLKDDEREMFRHITPGGAYGAVTYSQRAR
jgi:hypothetical protein